MTPLLEYWQIFEYVKCQDGLYSNYFKEIFFVDDLDESIHISLCPGMTHCYVTSQMQDTSEQCFSCIKLILWKIHETLKAWIETRASSMLDQNILGSNLNPGFSLKAFQDPTLFPSFMELIA